MKKAKHVFLSAFLIVMCLTLTVAATALRVGDIVGYVLATDIRAFYNGYEIPVYNIDGHVGVVAEDLRGYGFSVTWDDKARTLSIDYISDSVSAPAEIPATENTATGTRIMPVLHTDIVTYLDGKEVKSFNIGGMTVIYFEALKTHGNYVYDDGARLALISTKGHTFETKTLEALPREIIHAGGSLEAYIGSNSLEALNDSYSKGCRFIELDFVMSSDGIPVCLHDWSNMYSKELSETPITAEEFSKVKIFGLFTSLTLDDLCDWLSEHTDAYIVTDVKDDNIAVLRTILDKYPEFMERIIPQIYRYEEYAPVRAMGYSNIIFTLYSLPRYEDKVQRTDDNISFAKRNGILAVTASIELVNRHSDFVGKYTEAGVPLFVHTVNDTAEKQALYDKGVSSIYTDFAE